MPLLCASVPVLVDLEGPCAGGDAGVLRLTLNMNQIPRSFAAPIPGIFWPDTAQLPNKLRLCRVGGGEGDVAAMGETDELVTLLAAGGTAGTRKSEGLRLAVVAAGPDMEGRLVFVIVVETVGSLPLSKSVVLVVRRDVVEGEMGAGESVSGVTGMTLRTL
ncbi:hypothetical protein QFC19_001471 [Naganishia cerealis]|uniref:Uncharacterized protein n=1 Tax=Naganishia cerealis TaxID=610337 RepID=A0ACC2WJB1_9TREE|nr:hypothetical protein QFC19_001471 [Naganishia cerealis]